MVKKQVKGSLAQKIAGVLSVVPTQYDSEENLGDEAKLVDFDEEITDEEQALLSGFKENNVDFLADDPRYAGVKASRKRMQANSSDDSEEELNNGDFGNNAESNDESSSQDNQQENSENEDISDDAEDSINESAVEKESEVEDEDESEVESESGDDSFKHINETSEHISEQLRKGTCVRNQLSIWESLIDARIFMQKCVMAANTMPQKSNYKEMIRDESGEFRKRVNEIKDNLTNVLDKFIELQSLFIKNYPDTKHLGKNDLKSKSEVTESDEEIPSEDEVEEDKADESEAEEQSLPRKKRKLNEYENDLSDFYTKYRSYRNKTLENWNAKTRISITKNSGQPHSVVDQIEHILRDKEKLRKKSQLKKTEYKILGEESEPQTLLESNEDNGDTKQQMEEYNTEIFDDTDFYHQLLRELIECKSADMTDPVQLGRQWIQLQALRSKMKRKIDTKATKGRKIRYAVHSKLVNFMASNENQPWTEEATVELYNSLFGKIKKRGSD
ncbi:protein AATF [Dendroctonus ponderosae]